MLMDILSQLGKQGIMSSLLGSDILSTRCKPLELNRSQGIFSLRGSLSIIRPQLKNRSPVCKHSELRRLMDILSLLGNLCK